MFKDTLDVINPMISHYRWTSFCPGTPRSCSNSQRRDRLRCWAIPLTFITNEVTLPQQNLRSQFFWKLESIDISGLVHSLGRNTKLSENYQLPWNSQLTPHLCRWRSGCEGQAAKSEVKMPVKWRFLPRKGAERPGALPSPPESSSFSALGSEPCRGFSSSTEGVVASAPSNTSFLCSAPFLGSQKQATSSQSP